MVVGPWSQEREGLRGRLRVSPNHRGSFEVGVDLENVGAETLALRVGDPMGLTPKVRDGEGTEVRSTGARLETLGEASEVVVEPGQAHYQRLSLSPAEGGQGHLDLDTRSWELPPGTYELTAALGLEPPWRTPSRATTWSGSLELPPVALVVG